MYDAQDVAQNAAEAMSLHPIYAKGDIGDARVNERATQSCLLHDIFDNPFRLAAIDPAILCWNDGTLVKIARAIYEERAFDRLPILADALEEAGCENENMLAHLRGVGPHVRGCWPLDLILEKS